MTFEWGVTYDDMPAIFADGEFTPETPAALRTFLEAQHQHDPRPGALPSTRWAAISARAWKSARSSGGPS
jgi:hypothetical protein